MTRLSAPEVIQMLQLEPLPWEGGYFRRTHESSIRVTTESDRERSAITCIYYLITSDNFSALHLVRSDETFHFYQGDPVEMVTLTRGGKLETRVLGDDLKSGQIPQFTVPAGVIQGLRIIDGGSFALLGTNVGPGYDDADFTLCDRAELLARYPTHREMILKYTRS